MIDLASESRPEVLREVARAAGAEDREAPPPAGELAAALAQAKGEPDRACPACGGALAEMKGQLEESEEIDVIERSYRLVRHRRDQSSTASRSGQRVARSRRLRS